MRCCVLGSGSRGNATFISAGNTSILIDAGLSGLEVRRRLAAIGEDFSKLTAILVTHEHRDHISGVPVLSRKGRLPVFANAATYKSAGSNLNGIFAFREFDTGVSFCFQELEIHPFSISHDTADPVGFVVSDGRVSCGYCTDIGMVSSLVRHRLAGCQGLVLESNHDLEILKNGPYPPFLKQRVRGKQGHLANDDAALLVRELVRHGLRQVVLAHLSEINNRPEIALATVNRLLDNGGETAERPLVTLASQDRVSEVVRI